MTPRRLWLTALVVFVAAVAGVVVGRRLFPAAAQPNGELHALLHKQVDLDPEQDRQLHALDQSFAGRRQELEAAMRAENAGLARAIGAEHRIGPQVTSAIHASHRTMGELQKETLAQVFAMRRLLRPDQAAKFDAAIMKALTEDAKWLSLLPIIRTVNSRSSVEPATRPRLPKSCGVTNCLCTGPSRA